MDLLGTVNSKQSKKNIGNVSLPSIKKIENVTDMFNKERSSFFNLTLIDKLVKNKKRSMCGKGAHSKVWRYSHHEASAEQPLLESMSRVEKGSMNVSSCHGSFAVKEMSLASDTRIMSCALREVQFLLHVHKVRQIQQRSFQEKECWIVKMLGACVDPTKKVLHIAFEFAPLGTLQDWLDQRVKVLQSFHCEKDVSFELDKYLETMEWSDQSTDFLINPEFAPPLSNEINTSSNSLLKNRETFKKQTCKEDAVSSSLQLWFSVIVSHAKLVLSIKHQLAQAVDHLHHTLHYSHGDLKPGNVLLNVNCQRLHSTLLRSCVSIRSEVDCGGGGGGTNNKDMGSIQQDEINLLYGISDDPFGKGLISIALCDFGLSSSLTSSSSSSSDHNRKSTPMGHLEAVQAPSVPCGTNWYCSPSAFQSQLGQGIQGDTWSLGVMVWQLLDFGRHPVKHILQKNKSIADHDKTEKSKEFGSDDHVNGGSGGGKAASTLLKHSHDEFWDIFEAIELLPQQANRIASSLHRHKPSQQTGHRSDQKLNAASPYEDSIAASMPNDEVNAAQDSLFIGLNQIWEFIDSSLKVEE